MKWQYPMKHLYSLVVAFSAIVGSQAAVAQAGEPGDTLAIHVLTMGPGDDLFSKFGHISLMVEDTAKRTNTVYNYGTFDFNDPNLKFKYAKGFLTFWLSTSTFRRTVRRYEAYNRTLVVQTLNLTPAQRLSIAEKLRQNARPENREYDYRHYLDNCCTRIRDLLDEETDGALSRGRQDEPTDRTFRDWTRRALTGEYILPTMILFSLGPAVDRPITRWDEQFLPEVVNEDLDQTRIGAQQQPLVADKKQVVTRREPPPGQSSIPPVDLAVAYILFGSLIVGFGGGIALGRRALGARLTGWGMTVFGLVAGLGGLILTLFWTATAHTDTYFNENLLITPITHLWLIGPGLKLVFTAHLSDRTRRFLRVYLFAALGLILIDVLLKIGPFIQDNWEFIGFSAACTVAAIGALMRNHLIPLPFKYAA